MFAGIVDLLEASDLWSEPYGVTRIIGRCPNKTDESLEYDKSDWAYRLTEKAETSLSTGKLFPKGFPKDFSVLIVSRRLG